MPSASRGFSPNPRSRKGDAPPESGKRRIPRHLDPGPLSDPPEMEAHIHTVQVVLLLTTLWWLWRKRRDYFAGSNLSIYYPVRLRTGRTVEKKLKFRGPDLFVVLDALRKPRRNSWVVENEGGKYPDVIVEVLSRKTRATDRGKKKEIYEKIFKTHEYFLVDPEKETLEGYRLVAGQYVSIVPDFQGRLWSERLGLFIGMVDDPEVEQKVARLFTPNGTMVLDPPEEAIAAMKKADQAKLLVQRTKARAVWEKARADRAEEEKARAEQERVRAEQERDRLAAKLRALGVDPDQNG